MFLAKLGEHLAVGRKRLMLIESEPRMNAELRDFLTAEDLELTAVTEVEDALRELREQEFDCVILNPQTSGLDPSMLQDETLKTPLSGALPDRALQRKPSRASAAMTRGGTTWTTTSWCDEWSRAIA